MKRLILSTLIVLALLAVPSGAAISSDGDGTTTFSYDVADWRYIVIALEVFPNWGETPISCTERIPGTDQTLMDTNACTLPTDTLPTMVCNATRVTNLACLQRWETTNGVSVQISLPQPAAARAVANAVLLADIRTRIARGVAIADRIARAAAAPSNDGSVPAE